MAGFKAHFVTAAITGGWVGTALLQGAVIEPYGVLAGFFLTTLGGLLPDVDADHSIILATGMTVMAVIASFLFMFSQREGHSVMELVALWLGCYLFFKWIVFGFVTRLTIHRGLFHSIPAAVLGGVLTVILLQHLFGWSERASWLGGAFLWLGYMVHLILDEVTSLNVFRLQGVGHSLGSALKFHGPGLFSTLGVYLAIFFSLSLLPEASRWWYD
ncbi:MAG: metal-dependent hydrolase [Magnetococcales bacterium]|nr:metal-dependent hydrolase [Magnetococcales bacterium]MBF0149696.1 metal-dependent hydrolase [Magnetococcales bacterium]MBF0174066.1 metal-dependent hydrolase [Magnetococcales bacterium]MBF0346663.1 metal-dependent hydrolase [Magnetococcales bacterium]MBF0630746.1 metal-dependent hydrolase [Magnetococcales bacterium]